MANKYTLIANIKREGSHYNLYELISGKPITEPVVYVTKQRAHSRDMIIGKTESASGNVYWKRLAKDKVPADYKSPFVIDIPATVDSPSLPPTSEAAVVEHGEWVSPTDDEVREKISKCIKVKPDTLILDELNWKFAVRAALRAENILFLGHSGCGKTLTATSLAKALGGKLFRFNMGAMQDARASLIGNTHYDKDRGTFFAGSEFVRAIQTPGAYILLDEFTRISSDAENIILPVLDRDQRYLRLDEDPNTPTVKVAPGVVFIATANVGVEYTSTRILDRATKDRWSTIIELPLLTEDQEVALAKKLFPDLNRNYIGAIASVACYTRNNVSSDNPTLSTILSTRSVHEQCRLALDGFRFSEIMEGLVYNMFDPEGGNDSERGELYQKAQEKSNLDNESPLIFEIRSSKSDTAADDSDKEVKPRKNLFAPDEDSL